MTTETIWMQFKSRLHGFIRSKVGDAQVADDLLQEVFIKIHERLDQLSDESKVESWIYRITRNTVTDHFRANRFSRDVSEIPDQTDEVTDLHDYSAYMKCLMPFVRSLPEKDRNVVTEVVFNGMPQREYAEQHGLNYSTVKSRVQRSKLRMREKLSTCCRLETDPYGNIVSSDIENCTC